MIPIEAAQGITVDVSTSLVAMVTLLTVLVFALATLARPSRATTAWGIAYGLGMLGTYAWVAAHEMQNATLQAAASGLMISFEPVIWLGLRMHFGKRPIWWPVIAFVVAAPVLLTVSAETATFHGVFRVIFLIAGVFAALIAYELFSSDTPRRDIILPLALISCAFAIVAVVGAAAMLFNTAMSPVMQLAVIREINGVGTLVAGTCTAFTVVLLVRADGPPADSRAQGALRARRRLQKAQSQRDPGWSILDVRLDDPADLRAASTGAGFGLIVDRFHENVFDGLPAAADADRIADECSIVIIHGSEEAVEHHIRTLLRRISALEGGTETNAGIRLSASIGWATVSEVGYDYDDLVAAAGEGAQRAREKGGDRWERVRKAPTTLER